MDIVTLSGQEFSSKVKAGTKSTDIIAGNGSFVLLYLDRK